MSLDTLTVASFEPLVGDAFTIAGTPDDLTLVLETATVLADRPGGRDPFSLVFRGPPEPLLAQAICGLHHAQLGRLEIFVVPLGRDEAGVRYEAIFS